MRSVFFNVFQNLIVVLYVFDNDTNTVIRYISITSFFSKSSLFLPFPVGSPALLAWLLKCGR